MICTQIGPMPKVKKPGDREAISGKKTKSGEKFVLFFPPQTYSSEEWQAFPTFAKLPDVKPLTKEVRHSTSYQTRARCKGQ